jgi:hypothetical protein
MPRLMAAILTVGILFPVPAMPLDPSEDAAQVEACLKLVADNDAARGPHEEELLTEKTGPAGRLASAAATAPVESASCVGVVANACIQKAGDSNGTRIECYERERAVWDARLNQTYKRLRAAATIRRSSSKGRWRDRCRLGAYFILPPIKRSGSKDDSNSATWRRLKL